MQICAYSSCINPAEVEHIIEAPFSMSGTSTNSRQTVKVCKPCDSIHRMLNKTPGQLDLGPCKG